MEKIKQLFWDLKLNPITMTQEYPKNYMEKSTKERKNTYAKRQKKS